MSAPDAKASSRDAAVVVAVKHAPTAGDYLPFTPLPPRFHGGRVELVLVHEKPEDFALVAIA